MDRKEAIKVLDEMFNTYDELHENTYGDLGHEQMQALQMAIEALSAEPIELKRCGELLEVYLESNKTSYGVTIVAIKTPTTTTFFYSPSDDREKYLDMAGVTRCEHCKHNVDFDADCPFSEANFKRDDDDFCSCGEERSK